MMHFIRTTLTVERLEGRDVPSAKMGPGNTYAVGTDDTPNLIGTYPHLQSQFSKVQAYMPSGDKVPIGGNTAPSAPYDGFTGGYRTAMADFTGDGVQDLVVGTGPGGGAFAILDGVSGTVIGSDQPFNDPVFGTFIGGVFVAAGDIDNDGRAELVVTPDVSGGPRVLIYSFDRGKLVQTASFLGIKDEGFRGGCRPALGDINGDGFDDLVVAAGFGGGPRVAIYSGVTGLKHGDARPMINDFFLFEKTLTNGAYVAVGDVNGDGKADLVGGGGPGGGPRVLIIDGFALLHDQRFDDSTQSIASFFASPSNNIGGVRVAVKNLNGDKYMDVVTGGVNITAASPVTLWDGFKISHGTFDNGTSSTFTPFPDYKTGVFVG